MDQVTIHDVSLTKLKVINLDKGNVLRAIKNDELDFDKFGEAYFSTINPLAIKGWKLHKSMKLNLVVPVGNVKFVFHDGYTGLFREEVIGISNYCRLSVPPGIWVAFQGVSCSPSLILNIANIPHDPDESFSKPIEYFDYNWGDID